MARGKAGWKKLKSTTGVDPVDIFINQDSGKFGTRIRSNNEASIKEHATLADAESYIKTLNEEQAIEVVLIENAYRNDLIAAVTKVRVKPWGNRYTFMDGSNPGIKVFYQPTPEQLAAFEAKQAEYTATLATLERIKKEAWEIVGTMAALNRW